MLNVDLAINYIKKNGSKKFDVIWKDIKDELFLQLATKRKEFEIKSDFFVSMINNDKLLMIGKGIWDLREKYLLSEIEKININVFGNHFEKDDDEEILEDNDLKIDEEDPIEEKIITSDIDTDSDN